MGETVQKDMELMTPELIELKVSKLFKDSELSTLIKKRRQFHHKINNIAKRLEDFSLAIQYERALLSDINRRRRAKGMPLKKQNLDFSIIKRIQSLYSTAMVHFSDDYELHLEYYNFLNKYQTFHNAVTEHVRKMIQKFESNIQVFRVAASWFLRTVNHKEAIKIVLRGLARHRFNTVLYKDLIEIELKYPDEDRIQERLRKYVDDILKNVPGTEFLIEILELLETYPYLMDIQNYIITNLLEKHWVDEEVWHNLALRELKGFYYKATPEEEENKTTRKSIKRCIARYKEGLEKLPLRKQPVLWRLYLNTLIELQKENRDAAVMLKADLLKQALEEAKNAGIKLEERHWAAWVDACGSDEELLVRKLEEGTREHTQSTMLWTLYLKHYILKDKAVQSEMVFTKAVKALGHRATFIWDMYIDYHLLKSPVYEVKNLYEKACSEPYEEILKVFKPRYLTWMVLAIGIEDGRKLFWEMADKPPYCKELHEEMLQLEQMEHYRRDMNNHLKVIALYAKQFGNQDVDIWIQWIMLNREKKDFDQNEKELEIVASANKVLPERLANDFREKYNALPLA